MLRQRREQPEIDGWDKRLLPTARDRENRLSALRRYQQPLGSDLELASLSHVFYPLEWLVLLPIHVQAIHLQS